jgi:hypothetical protein
LAATVIPRRHNYPNPRIFLHEKLEKKYKNEFEAVIAHEIGHVWLHDFVGFNNPKIIHMIHTIEMTLNILGDIFK